MQYYWNKRGKLSCTKAAFLCNEGAHLVLSQQDRCLYSLSGLARLLPLPPPFWRGTFPAPHAEEPFPRAWGGPAPCPDVGGAPSARAQSSAMPPESRRMSGIGRRAPGCQSRVVAAEEVLGGRWFPHEAAGWLQGRPRAPAGRHPARA